MLVILTLQVSQASILAFQQLVQLLPSARATAASKRAVDRLESQGSDDGILAALRLLAHTVAFWTPEALKRHVPRYISRWASHREFSVREVSVVALTSQPTAMRCSCGVGNIHDGENRLLFTAIVFFLQLQYASIRSWPCLVLCMYALHTWLPLCVCVMGCHSAGCSHMHELGAARNAFAAMPPSAAAGLLSAQQRSELARAASVCAGPPAPGRSSAGSTSRSQHANSLQQQQQQPQQLAAGC
jgi:hypothetical protein